VILLADFSDIVLNVTADQINNIAQYEVVESPNQDGGNKTIFSANATKEYVDKFSNNSYEGYVNNNFSNAIFSKKQGVDSVVAENVSPIEHSVKARLYNLYLTFSDLSVVDVSYKAQTLPLDDTNRLVAGKIYVVYFEGRSYTCTAEGFNGVVYLGNKSPIDGASYSEPFAMFYNEGDGAAFEVGYTLWVFEGLLNEAKEEYKIQIVELNTTLNVNGTEYLPKDDNGEFVIKSICPTMVFSTSNEGVNISVEYIVDLQKIFVDIDSALDQIIEIQESLIEGGV
jgi:hypothetical protein